MSEEKTNVMRLLEQKKVPYTPHQYPHQEGMAVDGATGAAVLGRDPAAIGVRGRVYDKATIDMQLFIRHEEKKVRRAGGRTRGPAAFTSEDRARFKRNLTELLR